MYVMYVMHVMYAMGMGPEDRVLSLRAGACGRCRAQSACGHWPLPLPGAAGRPAASNAAAGRTPHTPFAAYARKKKMYVMYVICVMYVLRVLYLLYAR